MNYPLISEYVEAIKMAEDNFEELSYLRPVLDDTGQPVMSSGNFAVVFKMRDERDGKLYAVRCFHRDQEGREESYRLIEEELKDVESPYLVSFRYIDKELFVDSSQTDETEFPVFLMDWVEGITLDKYLRENIENQYTLKMLASHFCQLAQWLIPQPFAHGDLKPDNILVREDGTLVLVDYDGMYVPAMKGQKAREFGSPDFQNPLKGAEKFNENIDVFSLISIYVSLAIIAFDSDTLARFGSADRLLFSVNDYLDLQKSEPYRYILSSFSLNGKIRKLADVLNVLCKGKPITSQVQDVIDIFMSDSVCLLKNDSILPSAEDYIDAVLNKKIRFKTLKNLKVVIDNNRVVYVKGSNSVVFKMQDYHTKRCYALKCHTNVKYDIYNRLEVVRARMRHVESPYLVKMQIFYNEININDNYLIGEEFCFYPIVLMDWVEGVTMDAFVCKSDTSKDDFKRVMDSYKTMSSWLLEQNFSHGNVSPNNIIVTKDNKTILIDYDNMVFDHGDVVPELINKLKNENFCNPCLKYNKYEDNVDNFSLVSIMISLIFRLEHLSKTRNRYDYYGTRFFFKKEDYTNLDNSNLYKKINQCYSWDYKLSTFLLCLKQQLRAISFSKNEINFLFKDELYRRENDYTCRHEDQNTKAEKFLANFASAYSVLVFTVPFLLVLCTRLGLLSISIIILLSSLIVHLIFFIIASFRPNKKSHLDIGDCNNIGCLGSLGTFVPVLFMSGFIPYIINKHISWLHIPTYDEPWYIIMASIGIIFFVSNPMILSLFGRVYDYDTLKFDISNKKYQTRRKKFIDKLDEDEYIYNNSDKFQDSRLRHLICVNIFVILGCLYALYCFFFLHINLIYTNVIIVALSLGSTLLIKPLLKDKYAVYSHKTQRVYTFMVFTKMFLPMITIPFAFSGFTEFLNSTFEMLIPPYDLGWKEFIINAILYILIFFIPSIKADYA